VRIFLQTPDPDFEAAKSHLDTGYNFAIPSAEDVVDTVYSYVKTRVSTFNRAPCPAILEIQHDLNVLRVPLKSLTDKFGVWLNTREEAQRRL
jgi:hypothetical protein